MNISEHNVAAVTTLSIHGADEGGPFNVDDIVRTKKGAKFWGKVVSCYAVMVPKFSTGVGEDEATGEKSSFQTTQWRSEWRCDVMAIDPGFLGSIHVYPAEQLEVFEPSIFNKKEWDALAHDALGGALINAYNWVRNIRGTPGDVDTIALKAMKNMEEVTNALVERWTALREKAGLK